MSDYNEMFQKTKEILATEHANKIVGDGEEVLHTAIKLAFLAGYATAYEAAYKTSYIKEQDSDATF